LTNDGNGVSRIKQSLPTNCCNCSQISEQEHQSTLSVVLLKVQIQTQKSFTKSNAYYSLKHFKEDRRQFKRVRGQTGLYNSAFLYSTITSGVFGAATKS
jgi:hypothetical protein